MIAAEPNNHRWLRKWLRGEPHQIIGTNSDPYLLRWYIIPRNPVVNLYLHQFLRSDDDRALHDHPWWFWSVVLAGHYYEHRADGRRIRRRAGSIAYRSATTRHRVELPISQDRFSLLRREESCWTVVLTGPRRRIWGFWCPGRLVLTGPTVTGTIDMERFVHHKEWGEAGCGEPFGTNTLLRGAGR